jgi:hypothetical protein
VVVQFQVAAVLFLQTVVDLFLQAVVVRVDRFQVAAVLFLQMVVDPFHPMAVARVDQFQTVVAACRLMEAVGFRRAVAALLLPVVEENLHPAEVVVLLVHLQSKPQPEVKTQTRRS